ncbi:MAG: hypothetical protein ACFFCO_02165 [Promethearchaeota archaeon]
MNRRAIAIALICIGLSALAFGLALGQHEIIHYWLQRVSDAYIFPPPLS